MTDWYFAGMFDQTFWAVVGKGKKISGRTAAQVLRPLVAKAREPDLSWMSKVYLLDALCHCELAFTIKRSGEQVQWVLNPFRYPLDARGDAETISDAVDALAKAASRRYPAYRAQTKKRVP
jgi:hypothetical protein